MRCWGPVALGAAIVVAAATAASAGTLGFVSPPGNVTISAVTLSGPDGAGTGTLPMDVNDSTGLGLGWNITMTSTQFAAGSYVLPVSATTVNSAPTDTCDTGVLCTPAVTTVTYPYTLPAGSTPPTATRVFNATAATGLLAQTVTPTFKVHVPANSFSGSYSSTWTITLSSGP